MTTITQGTFAYLPELDDDEVEAQIQYALEQGWAISIEYTSEPHPRNRYWEMWGQPMFDLTDPQPAIAEIGSCRAWVPDQYVKVNAFNSRRGRETIALSFLVQRPTPEPKVTS